MGVDVRMKGGNENASIFIHSVYDGELKADNKKQVTESILSTLRPLLSILKTP